MRTLLLSILAVLTSLSIFGQELPEQVIGFEKSVPEGISTRKSSAKLSPDHFRDGERSLLWKFKLKGSLSIDGEIPFIMREQGERDQYLSTFIIWVYGDGKDGHLKFSFEKDGRNCCGFTMNMGFTGWRAAWVCYQRDMEGTPEAGMDRIVITSDYKGKVYIDHMIKAIKCDPRHQTADFQVPFVNKATDNHWLVLLQERNTEKDTLITSLRPEVGAEMKLIEKRFREQILKRVKVDDAAMNKIRKSFATYRIVRNGDKVTGLPIYFNRASEAYERMEVPGWKNWYESKGQEVRAYFDLMNQIARCWNSIDGDSKEKQELENMFLDMYVNITDQGVTDGSGWGNITHYGYSFRNMFPAYFLMKEPLRKAGKLDEAAATLRWFAMTGNVFEAPQKAGLDMDEFNTKVSGCAASILLMEDGPEKEEYLRRFARRMDFGCRPSDGLAGAFKSDGAAFHHRNNYPAYAVGGMGGATEMIQLFHGTSFAISELGHETVRKALMAMRFYCNRTYFPLAMSGRHPDGKGTISPYHFATMALAGSSDGSEEIDREMAAAFLRLVEPPYKMNGPEKACAKKFREMGIKPEAEPQGNMTLSYGCTSIHRYGDWSAVVRGHSRYFWASEHYERDNFYGRYLANASLQILYRPDGDDLSMKRSLWQEEGFNWNRIPGATAVNLPWDMLRAKIYNVDKYSGNEEMLLSDESYAGGLDTPSGDGVFAMKLHGHDKYDGTLRARKSYHMVGGQIVALGTGICDKDSEHNTETTLFQQVAPNDEAIAWWNSQKLCSYNETCRNCREDVGFTDALGAYWQVRGHEGSQLKLEVNFPQESRNEGNGKVEYGNWATLYLDHGKAPENAEYEFAVCPDGTKPEYTVLNMDNRLHAVRSGKDGIETYAFFEAGDSPCSVQTIKSVSIPCLAAIDRNAYGIDKNAYGIDRNAECMVLTVSNPDMAFYEGPSDEKFDKDGKRIERSIYSRKWIDNPAAETTLKITLDGLWKAEDDCDSIAAIEHTNTSTTITYRCKEGRSISTRLYKEQD